MGKANRPEEVQRNATRKGGLRGDPMAEMFGSVQGRGSGTAQDARPGGATEAEAPRRPAPRRSSKRKGGLF